jgi:hypothetical protein
MIRVISSRSPLSAKATAISMPLTLRIASHRSSPRRGGKNQHAVHWSSTLRRRLSSSHSNSMLR